MSTIDGSDAVTAPSPRISISELTPITSAFFVSLASLVSLWIVDVADSSRRGDQEQVLVEATDGKLLQDQEEPFAAATVTVHDYHAAALCPRKVPRTKSKLSVPRLNADAIRRHCHDYRLS